ncbi:M12 family metallopeptidase [Pseudoxanthomonas sp. LH2527]|uniref:M12 family metallopeptidase n=1 Tax=Pseudoxanthomonas sp. LH2527 TaxID=2923249 RepID=UPI001F146E45|nr:M12 family metallopeptidase [Pseudoxanthomonas sp. LH2527]MCH6484699.1 M12 family metallopeptidase [Pseudoxanthomonas sp. LH2527]
MATKKNPPSRAAGGGANDGGSGRTGEFRGAGPVRTALIRGDTFGVRPVQYVEVDGMAMFEGDIVLGTVEEVERMSDMLREESASGVVHAVMISGAQFQWPNCRVPFTIDAALPNQQRVTDAIAHWEANTRFRFVPRTTEADFVTFRTGSGCSAQVGRRGGQQFVNLAAGCTLGNTIHEIGHVVGLWHEQSREDRDTFVRINWEKIQSGFEHNFNQHITDGDDIGPYDYGSIMHYPLNAFSVDGSNTITPIGTVPPGTVIGQRAALSAGDIAAVNSRCPAVTIKESIKDNIADTRKEQIFDTRKEQIKDIRLDTRKELITDTLKEQIRDTVKEGVFDPGPTLAENVFTPGRPPILVNPQLNPQLNPALVGSTPFAVATPHEATAAGAAGTAAELDNELHQLAEELARLDAARGSLQAQYDQTRALLEQMLRQDDGAAG